MAGQEGGLDAEIVREWWGKEAAARSSWPVQWDALRNEPSAGTLLVRLWLTWLKLLGFFGGFFFRKESPYSGEGGLGVKTVCWHLRLGGDELCLAGRKLRCCLTEVSQPGVLVVFGLAQGNVKLVPGSVQVAGSRLCHKGWLREPRSFLDLFFFFSWHRGEGLLLLWRPSVKNRPLVNL